MSREFPLVLAVRVEIPGAACPITGLGVTAQPKCIERFSSQRFPHIGSAIRKEARSDEADSVSCGKEARQCARTCSGQRLAVH